MKYDDMIDELAAEASPVAPLSTGKGRMLLAASALISIAAVLLVLGPRPDIADGSLSPILLLTLGLFALVAMAAGAAATRMATPAVGNPVGGAGWAVAAMLLLPLAALADVSLAHAIPDEPLADGLRCVAFGQGSAAFSLAILAGFLRKGAPTSPERAGSYAGLAAGAVGAFAITLECDIGGLWHLGIWHVAIILAAAGAGRLLVTPLLRW